MSDGARRGSRHEAGARRSACAPVSERHFSARKLVPQVAEAALRVRPRRAGATRGADCVRGTSRSTSRPRFRSRRSRRATPPASCARIRRCRPSSRYERMDERLYDRRPRRVFARAGPAADRALPDERGLHRQPHDRLDRTGQTEGAARHGHRDHQRVAAHPQGDRSSGAHGTRRHLVQLQRRHARDLREDHGHPVRAREGQHGLPARSAAADAAGVRQHDRNEADGARRSSRTSATGKAGACRPERPRS